MNQIQLQRQLRAHQNAGLQARIRRRGAEVLLGKQIAANEVLRTQLREREYTIARQEETIAARGAIIDAQDATIAENNERIDLMCQPGENVESRTCGTCRKVLKTIKGLKSHKRIHNLIVCCGRKYYSAKSLDIHRVPCRTPPAEQTPWGTNNNE